MTSNNERTSDMDEKNADEKFDSTDAPKTNDVARADTDADANGHAAPKKMQIGPSTSGMWSWKVDLPWPDNLEMFEADIPMPAVFQKAYGVFRTSKVQTLDGKPMGAEKILRLVFVVVRGAPTIRGRFIFQPHGQHIIDPGGDKSPELLDCVVDPSNGEPATIWSIPIPQETQQGNDLLAVSGEIES
jgi:hypothetical protein